MIKWSDQFVREPDLSKGGPNTFYFNYVFLLKEGKVKEAERLYYKAIENGFNPAKDQFYNVDPYYIAHFPEFDDIEECEKRAVKAMMDEIRSQNKQKQDDETAIRSTGHVPPICSYWNMMDHSISILNAGIAELVKDHPELTAKQALDHVNLLMYVYNDM